MGSGQQKFVPQPNAEASTTRGQAAFAAAANNGVNINAAQIGPGLVVQSPSVTLTPRVSGKFRLTATISGVTDADADVLATLRANGVVINNPVPPSMVITSGGAAHRFSITMDVITAAYALGVALTFDLNMVSGQNITIGIGQATFTAEELPA